MSKLYIYDATLGTYRDLTAADLSGAKNSSGQQVVDTLATPGAARMLATSSAASSVSLSPNCRKISMYSTQDAWYSISGTATTSSHFIGKGERLDFSVPANTTISSLRDTTDGALRITELA